MSTEQSSRFQGKQKSDIPDLASSSVGPKEPSGFIDNKLYEDCITGYPGERWNNFYRQTGTTVHKDKFLPYSFSRVRLLIIYF
jgi:hypothetical protein